MNIPKNPLAQALIQLCKAKDIKHIIISPGSRNAPLIIGFTNDIFFKCYSIVDERSAGFFALGIAQQIKHPVALVCTSGSALLNYFPAVAEAFYSDIPLVVLSADRPKYLIGIGDGQTIDQKDVYGTHVLYSTDLKLDIDENNETSLKNKKEASVSNKRENSSEKLLSVQQLVQNENIREINNAINMAIAGSGPVHINCPFDEPLYEMVTAYSVEVTPFETIHEVPRIPESEFEEMAAIWNTSKRKMILAGVNAPNNIERNVLNTLAEDDSLVVFTETTSNLHHENFFPNIDQIIMPLDEEGLKMLQPDLLVTFGGMVVSKKIKAFLRNYQPKHHWHIDEKKAYNTYFCLSRHIKSRPQDFFMKLLSKSNVVASTYRSYWYKIKEYRKDKHKSYLLTLPYSDLSVFNMVLNSTPKSTLLHLGNSSTIRYSQLFDLDSTLRVFCNRGTSGIDGSTSTAIGGATVTKNQTVFITGDLSLFYDQNAFWNRYIPKTFRIIVINNGGGGIFRILPGPKNTKKFESFFETTHDLNAKDLCKMHDLDYSAASNETELLSQLKSFYANSKRPKLLEIFTPRKKNDQLLIDYFKFIR